MPSAKSASRSLPSKIAAEDKRLEDRKAKAEADAGKHGNALLELRWHWTEDLYNDDRVTQTAYASAVGRSRSTIGSSVRGYVAQYPEMAKDEQQKQLDASKGKKPAKAPKPKAEPKMNASEARARGNASEQRQVAIEAIAKARGMGVATVDAKRAGEVAIVVDYAEMVIDMAEKKGEKIPSFKAAVKQAIRAKVKTAIKREKEEAAAKKKERENGPNIGRLMEKSAEEFERVRQALCRIENMWKPLEIEPDNEDYRPGVLCNLADESIRQLQILKMDLGRESGVDWDAEAQKIIEEVA